MSTLTDTAGCSNVRTVQSHWVEDAGLRRHKVTHKADLRMTATDEHGNDYDMHIPDSLIVPSLGINLISTDHLNELQYWVVLGPSMQQKYMRTPDGRQLPLSKAGRLPFLPIKAATAASSYALSPTLPATCTRHARLMHVSKHVTEAQLRAVASDVAPDNEYSLPKCFCRACAACKQHDVPHPRITYQQGVSPLDLVWSDVAGPLPPSLQHRNKYAVLFMDDFTEVRWVYYIKRKSDVAAAFTLFCRDVKQWGTVNRIRTDNGGEYTGAAFKQVEVDEVVAHEWNAPRTSQQMGKAERSWLTLKEMARAALMHAELPDAAWERAMATAVYTRNRLPTSRHPETTPMQSLTGKRSTHKHFKIFGALAYRTIRGIARRSLPPQRWAFSWGMTARGM